MQFTIIHFVYMYMYVHTLLPFIIDSLLSRQYISQLLSETAQLKQLRVLHQVMIDIAMTMMLLTCICMYTLL